MYPSLLRRHGNLCLIIPPLTLAVALFGAPSPATAPPAPPAPPIIALRGMNSAHPAGTPSATAPAAQPQADTPVNHQPPLITPAASATGAPLRIGIQAGHWRAEELPGEQAHLRAESGAFAAGYVEAAISLDIARRVAVLLASDQIVVDVLPATIPPGYSADAFVALHADGSDDSGTRGFKLAVPWWASRASERLLDALSAEYERATGLPRDGAITANMRGYYAFNYRRYAHAIAKTTPAVIVELGFLTSAGDRALLVDRPDIAAVGIATGIVRYLNERDPRDRAALLPPDFGMRRAASAAGLDVLAAPQDSAETLLHIEAERPVIPFEQREGWYHVVVVGAWDVVGWVREDAVVGD